MYRFSVLFLLLAGVAGAAEPLRIFDHPAIDSKSVVFGFAGDLWVVIAPVARPPADRWIGLETSPVISPDGSKVAFAGEYDGNLDVYVVPMEGGEPVRLTYHPDPDLPVAWTPDGKSVVFRSTRSSYGRFTRLFTVPVVGGPETQIPLPMAEEASYAPDGSHLAYVPFTNSRGFPGGYIAWKRYRGGSAPFIWIADLKTSAVQAVPHTDSNDFNPMWIGPKVYFLSDRDGSATLYDYDTDSKKVTCLLPPSGVDIKSASACGDAIVLNRIDGMSIFDLKNARCH